MADTVTKKPASASGDIHGEDWVCLEASAALALTEETLPEEKPTEQCTPLAVALFSSLADRWQSLRDQANFSAVRAYIENNAKITPWSSLTPSKDFTRQKRTRSGSCTFSTWSLQGSP